MDGPEGVADKEEEEEEERERDEVRPVDSNFNWPSFANDVLSERGVHVWALRACLELLL